MPLEYRVGHDIKSACNPLELDNHMTTTAAFALRTTPEIKAAAKSLVALWPHVTLRHNEKGLGLGSNK